MSNLHIIDSLLKNQSFETPAIGDSSVYDYATAMAMVENCIVVVSDLRLDKSRIFYGHFAKALGIEEDTIENSIWERNILSLMTPEEQEQKYLAEIRFFNYLRRLPRHRRQHFYLATRIKFNRIGNRIEPINVIHRMYYIYDADCETVRYAICIYGPELFPISSRSIIIDSITGKTEPLTSDVDSSILSRRELQVLQLIERGHTSTDISRQLNISKHTVSRHRQTILSKLQVKNSTEACRVARQINLL
ncbi:MAG: response regulator transcription factor [Bacteroidales bacterium]|nr:response regulator transcription factor [Bacteroidales bacterium]